MNKHDLIQTAAKLREGFDLRLRSLPTTLKTRDFLIAAAKKNGFSAFPTHVIDYGPTGIQAGAQIGSVHVYVSSRSARPDSDPSNCWKFYGRSDAMLRRILRHAQKAKNKTV